MDLVGAPQEDGVEKNTLAGYCTGEVAEIKTRTKLEIIQLGLFFNSEIELTYPFLIGFHFLSGQ